MNRRACVLVDYSIIITFCINVILGAPNDVIPIEMGKDKTQRKTGEPELHESVNKMHVVKGMGWKKWKMIVVRVIKKEEEEE